MTSARDALAGLRDVRGVEGSFLFLRPGGELVVRDALPVLSEAGLTETSRRLAKLFQTLESVCPASEEVVLRFEGLSLFARCNEKLMLGVVAGDSASIPALRMASNLVLRELSTAELTPAPAANATPPTSGTRLFWRGSPIGGE